jgi:lactate permease
MQTFLAVIPIAVLLLCLVVFKTSMSKSGFISLGLALVIGIGFFGLTAQGILIASGKGSWLAVVVGLIIWCALFLYHLVSDFGAIDVINKNITLLVKDKFVVFLLLAWLFTGMLQGIAGFGIPTVIVAPILISLGVNPVKALTAALLGHSWAVTFGSMGAAFVVIQNITNLPPETLGIPMWVFNTVTMLLTGIGVSFISGDGFKDGLKSILKGLPYVLPVAVTMSTVQHFLMRFAMYTLGTLVPALSGLAVMFIFYGIRNKIVNKGKPKEKITLYRGKLTLLQAVFPYALIMILLLSFQFLIPREVRGKAELAFDFPAVSTTLDPPHEVRAENGYTPIRLFAHPFPVLLIASGAACLIYRKAGVFDKKVFKNVVKMTVRKGVPATIALVAFGNLSLIMMDSGMMMQLALSVASATGNIYPFFAPSIGVLATFMTGNNTNSNVMFGEFQRAVAENLGFGQDGQGVMAAAQSIAGGLGCAVGSTIVYLGALATKQTDKISVVLKRIIPWMLIIAGAMGIVNYIFLNYFITGTY